MSLRLLLILPTSPLPIFSGGRVRMYEILRRLAQRHDISVLSFWRNEEARAGLAQLGRELGIEVNAIPFARLGLDRQLIPTLWRRWQGRRAGLPTDIALWDQPAMHQALRQALVRKPIDVVQVEWPYLAPYALAHPDRPSLLITHDIFSIGLARRAGLASSPRQRRQLEQQANAWARYESQVYPRFGAVAAMSAADADIIQRRAPTARVAILPNGVDTAALTPGEVRAQARNLIFVGSPTHPPNLDAACWFQTAIWPDLHQRHPGLHLTLVNVDHPQVRACLQPGVELLGRQPDLTPLYRQADIAIAPLRAGSGTRLKILEAFALGVPVVSTPVGHEGLAVIPNEHLLSAETATAFGDAITRLLADADLRRRLIANARRLAVAHYDWDQIVAQHEAIYRDLIA